MFLHLNRIRTILAILVILEIEFLQRVNNHLIEIENSPNKILLNSLQLKVST
jgi:hypothetical protein